MRRALRPGKRGAAGKRGRPLARHAPHVRGEPGAKPFVDDLLLGRGFVRSRAAPSLRSIESQPSTQGFVAPGADAATVAAAVVGGGVPRPARSASVRPSRSSSLFPSHPSAPRVAPPCPSPAKGSGGRRFSRAASRGRPRRAGRSRGRLRVPLRPVGARGREGKKGKAGAPLQAPPPAPPLRASPPPPLHPAGGPSQGPPGWDGAKGSGGGRSHPGGVEGGNVGGRPCGSLFPGGKPRGRGASWGPGWPPNTSASGCSGPPPARGGGLWVRAPAWPSRASLPKGPRGRPAVPADSGPGPCGPRWDPWGCLDAGAVRPSLPTHSLGSCLHRVDCLSPGPESPGQGVSFCVRCFLSFPSGLVISFFSIEIKHVPALGCIAFYLARAAPPPLPRQRCCPCIRTVRRFLLVFGWPHPRSMELPRLGVELVLRLLAYARAAAVPDLSLVSTPCVRRRMEPATSWFLVRFVSSVPRGKVLNQRCTDLGRYGGMHWPAPGHMGFRSQGSDPSPSCGNVIT